MSTIRFGIIDASNILVRTGTCMDHDLVLQLMRPGERVITPSAELPRPDGRATWNDATGAFVVRGINAAELARKKAVAAAQVDGAAERVRMRALTPGAGQRAEYDLTEAEARRLLVPGAPAFTEAAYPMLAAEIRALGAAAPAPAVVAAAVLQAAQTAVATLAAVKEARRRAKLAIAASSTEAELAAASAVVWPGP